MRGEGIGCCDDPKYRELPGLVDVGRMTRDEGWRFDLYFLAREIKRLNYDPFRQVGREVLEAHLRHLDQEIPKLTDPQIVVGFMKHVARAGDVHTVFRHPDTLNNAKKLLPVQFYGLFITAASRTSTGRLHGRWITGRGSRLCSTFPRPSPI